MQDEFSSFSDYNNCVPKEKLTDELTKNLYNFSFKLLDSLIEKFPQVFYEKQIWSKVIGPNCFLSKLSGFFRKSKFTEKILIDEKSKYFYEREGEGFFNQSVYESYRSQRELAKSFDISSLNDFYTNYMHKLIDNDESLLLLMHVTPSLFVKYFLLKIFKKILKTLPLEIWLLNHTRLGWDRLAGDISNSFVSFNFILFLEILKNLNYKKYLVELVNFLTFFAEEGLVFKFDFDIFVKTSEFIFFKMLAIESDSQRQSALISIFKLFNAFAQKGFSMMKKISKKEFQVFKGFCLKIFLFCFEELLPDSSLQVPDLIIQILKLLSILFNKLRIFDENRVVFSEQNVGNLNHQFLQFDFYRLVIMLKSFFDRQDIQVNFYFNNKSSYIYLVLSLCLSPYIGIFLTILKYRLLDCTILD